MSGHLFGSQLGGTGGTNYANFIAMSTTSNLLFRDYYENEIRRAAETQCVLYWVWAGYIGDQYFPSGIYGIAIGDKGFMLPINLPNP
jgi:hypothetical protein